MASKPELTEEVYEYRGYTVSVSRQGPFWRGHAVKKDGTKKSTVAPGVGGLQEHKGWALRYVIRLIDSLLDKPDEWRTETVRLPKKKPTFSIEEMGTA